MEKHRKIHKLSDIELIDRYKANNDTLNIGILFKRYTDFVFLVCIKYLKNEQKSKDATMQIFEKLLLDLKKHKIEKFKPWLHIVSKNHCLLQLRKDKYTLKKNKDYEKDYKLFMENETKTYLINEEDKEKELNKLEVAIQRLNNEQKECIELFYIQEKSYKEVVDETGYSMKQVKSYIQNGKRNLKNILTKLNITLLFLWYIF